MSDISEDEAIEKPKRTMSEAQKQALKKGRELARMNRMKSDEPVVSIDKPEKKPRKKKEAVVEAKVEPIVETKVETKVEPPPVVVRKARKTIEPVVPVVPVAPVVVVEPVAPAKKERKPRAKKIVETAPPQVWKAPQPIKPTMVFV